VERRTATIALAALLLCTGSVFGAETRELTTQGKVAPVKRVAIISIVIDDVGNRREEGLRAIELPGALTYAILPHTAHGSTLARLAHSLDKEIIVHIPMEAIGAKPLGRGGLTADLSRQQFEQRTLAAIGSIPHAQGVSNHMGSHLTTMERPMQWLMNILLGRKNWMFLDSRTTAESVAEATARHVGLRTTFRDVFLDNEVNVTAIRARFRELLDKARRHGSAVAIGHPYPLTLQVLAEELPHFVASNRTSAVGGNPSRDARRNIRLVPLSHLIAKRSRRVARASQRARASSFTAPTSTVLHGAKAPDTLLIPVRPRSNN
jgi:polysaccharide deacetylase 2 family uncharacterized protein YibQ